MAAQPITIARAREVVLAETRPLEAVTIRVEDALGSVLAQELSAATDVPPFASSAMDGYAVEAGPAERTLTVVGEARAGSPAEVALGQGEAIRVSTGAAIPAGTGGVIRQEDVEQRGEQIRTVAPTRPREHIREAGEDMRADTVVLPAGTPMGAAEVAAAVAAGAGWVVVTRRPRVAIACTGDELQDPGKPLGPGEIHNSNGPMLRSLAQRAGALIIACDHLPDQPEATREALAAALERADVVVISGGVSVGLHDHVKPALAALGVEQRFWRVALQPGGPTWFGVRSDKLVFGLPGNPVSAAVTFALFVRPALAAAQGFQPRSRIDRHGRLAVTVARNPRREQALRVRLEQRNGDTLVTPNGPQGSHVVSSLVGADALAFIPAGDGELAAGTTVRVEALSGWAA